MYCDLCYTLKLFAVFSLWYLHSGFTVYLLICLKYLLHIMICFILPFFEMNLLGVHIIVEKKKLYAFLYKKPFRCTNYTILKSLGKDLILMFKVSYIQCAFYLYFKYFFFPMDVLTNQYCLEENFPSPHILTFFQTLYFLLGFLQLYRNFQFLLILEGLQVKVILLWCLAD